MPFCPMHSFVNIRTIFYDLVNKFNVPYQKFEWQNYRNELTVLKPRLCFIFPESVDVIAEAWILITDNVESFNSFYGIFL